MAKEIVEHQLCLDIEWMRHQGWLHDRAQHTVKWTRGDEECGRMGVRFDEDAVVVSYRMSVADGDWQSYEKRLAFSKVPCRYGGYRCWFRCPQCGRKVRRLYMNPSWGCRTCLKLAYETENASSLDRSRLHADKVDRKFGNIGLTRPKGMHAGTYSRLLAEHLNAESRSSDELWSAAKKILDKCQAKGFVW